MTIISGALIAPNGNPLPGIGISLISLQTSSVVIVQTESTTITDANGNYSIAAEVGRYQVILSVGGQPDRDVGVIRVYADSAAGTLNDFLTAPTEDELTPAIVAFVQQMSIAAKTSETNASAFAATAGESAQDAGASAGISTAQATAAGLSAGAADGSAMSSAGSATTAHTSETNAKTSEENAKTSETNAANSAVESAGYAGQAHDDATTSDANATAADGSATSASGSATAADGSAIAAHTSEVNAKTSETNAKNSEANAAISETNAAGSATTAGTHAQDAGNSATDAGGSATTAGESATAALNSQNVAKASEDNAKVSETNAKTSETNAAGSASAAQQAAASVDTASIQAAIEAKADAGANSNITSLSGLTTALSIAQGGTGAGDAATARTNLGVGYGTAAGTVAQGNDSRLNTVNSKTGGTISSAITVAGSVSSPSFLPNSISTEDSGNLRAIGMNFGGLLAGLPSTFEFYQVPGQYNSLRFLIDQGLFTFRGTGVATATSWTSTSDIRLKQKIINIVNALDKIDSLEGFTYELYGQPGAGVSAQALQAVLPEAVIIVGDAVDADGNTVKDALCVNYGALTAFVLQAVKELKQQVANQENEIAALKNTTSHAT